MTHSRHFRLEHPALLALGLMLLTNGLSFHVAAAQEAAHAPGWVVIPVEEYRVLRAKAYPVEHDPEPPPMDATLSRVEYDLRLTGDLATGRATLTVDVLKDGWVRVPIPSGLLVREAKLDGKQVSLVPSAAGKGGAQLSVLLSHAGRSVVQLDLNVPVTSTTGEESIALPATESGMTRASIELQRQDVDLRISGGLISAQSQNSGETKWVAYGRGNEPLTFTWRRKTEDHHVELPLRLRGSITQLASIGEDSSSIYAEANLEIVQGAARTVKIHVPDKITINQVSGAMVADWENKGEELSVIFLEPVDQNARFVISGEARLPRDGLIDIPLLRLVNVERETGGVAVEILGAGEVKDLKSSGLEEADATDLGEMIASRQSPSLAAFRFRANGTAAATRTLSVNVARYAQQAVLMANVEEARYQVLLSSDGKTLVRARYAVRNNQRNFVKITLPPGAVVWSAVLAGKPVRPGQSPDGSLLLPLEKSRGGEDAQAFAVEILYLSRGPAWDEKGRARVILPGLDLPVSRTGMLLYYPPAFRISTEPGVFRTQTYENPTSVAFALESGGIGGGRGGGVGSGITAPMSAPVQAKEEAKDKRDAKQALLDSFRAKSSAGKVSGIVPVSVDFPAFGPSMFLVSELTAENQTPSAEISFQREKKGGAR